LQDFKYVRPKTLEEALELIDEYGKEAKILAGGTDVIVGLRGKTMHCKYLIDIKGIEDLHCISCDDKNGLSIGCAVTLNEIIDSRQILPSYKILIDSAKTLANFLIRNRATLAGNICNSSPGGDMLPASLVLDGKVYAASVNGSREIPLKDFFLGVKKNALKENEILTKVVYPTVNGKGSFLKKSRIKGHDLSQISVAGYIRNDGILKLSLGAVAPTPVLIDNFENYKNKSLAENKEKITDIVMNKINPIGDVRSTKEYRLAMARYLTSQIAEKLGEGV
jgi:CO/xanthine dehydrogenase FAD-binding subunit